MGFLAELIISHNIQNSDKRTYSIKEICAGDSSRSFKAGSPYLQLHEASKENIDQD